MMSPTIYEAIQSANDTKIDEWIVRDVMEWAKGTEYRPTSNIIQALEVLEHVRSGWDCQWSVETMSVPKPPLYRVTIYPSKGEIAFMSESLPQAIAITCLLFVTSRTP